MVTIERTSGQAVRIGPHALRVLAVQRGRVVIALLDAREECLSCGERLVAGSCPFCRPATAPPRMAPE